MWGKALVISCVAVVLSACSPETNVDKTMSDTVVPDRAEREFWTLYRNSPTDSTMRIHVASFDSTEAGSSEANYAYNQENCVAVSKSLGKQLDIPASYWCERGRFKN